MNDAHDSQAEWRDSAAAFVLGALDPLEEQAFRRRMMRDPAIAAYVERELQPVADELLQAVEPIEPPASLSRSLIAAAQADLDAREVLDRSSAHVTSRPPRPRGGSRGWLGLDGRLGLKPAIAMAALAVALAGSFALGRIAGDDAGQVVPQAPSVAFEGVTANGASGRASLLEGGERGAVIYVRGLSPSRGGDVYQLWIARGRRVYPSTVFAVGRDRSGASYVPEDVIGADALMITREPAGGSDQPTGDVLVKAEI